MEKRYVIKKVKDNLMNIDNIWEGIPALSIDCYPWNENNYMPVVNVKMYYTDTGFCLKFMAYEDEVKVNYHHVNEPVYKDSCVEFFFKPDPEHDDRYLNFEVNSLGILLLGLGTGREDRVLLPDEIAGQIKILHSINDQNIKSYMGPFWSIEYFIPFDFIRGYFNEASFEKGTRINANFYKCGDETRYPHYGCWNPIKNDTPDFHRPEYFGTLIFE